MSYLHRSFTILCAILHSTKLIAFTGLKVPDSGQDTQLRTQQGGAKHTNNAHTHQQQVKATILLDIFFTPDDGHVG